MNSDTNEIKEIDIEYLPHIMLFLKDGKGPVVYDGDSTLEDLIKFVESDGKESALDPNAVRNLKFEFRFLSFFLPYCG